LFIQKRVLENITPEEFIKKIDLDKNRSEK